ncbi:hypothetical protein DFH09DRAFT_1095033 [Mycena vulgaris]|nr:hypothetical protein DFH09DRAFT_1095033 [Mycena vulgaris]
MDFDLELILLRVLLVFAVAPSKNPFAFPFWGGQDWLRTLREKRTATTRILPDLSSGDTGDWRLVAGFQSLVAENSNGGREEVGKYAVTQNAQICAGKNSALSIIPTNRKADMGRDWSLSKGPARMSCASTSHGNPASFSAIAAGFMQWDESGELVEQRDEFDRGRRSPKISKQTPGGSKKPVPMRQTNVLRPQDREELGTGVNLRARVLQWPTTRERERARTAACRQDESHRLKPRGGADSHHKRKDTLSLRRPTKATSRPKLQEDHVEYGAYLRGLEDLGLAIRYFPDMPPAIFIKNDWNNGACPGQSPDRACLWGICGNGRWGVTVTSDTATVEWDRHEEAENRAEGAPFCALEIQPVGGVQGGKRGPDAADAPTHPEIADPAPLSAPERQPASRGARPRHLAAPLSITGQYETPGAHTLKGLHACRPPPEDGRACRATSITPGGKHVPRQWRGMGRTLQVPRALACLFCRAARSSTLHANENLGREFAVHTNGRHVRGIGLDARELADTVARLTCMRVLGAGVVVWARRAGCNRVRHTCLDAYPTHENAKDVIKKKGWGNTERRWGLTAGPSTTLAGTPDIEHEFRERRYTVA